MKVFDENIPGFFFFIGNQTVQDPNDSFNAASKGFKRHQTMTKGSYLAKPSVFSKIN